jgi:hypothetical protein
MCIMYFNTYARASVGIDAISTCLMHGCGSFTINIHMLRKESTANTEKSDKPYVTPTNNYVQHNTRWAEQV